MIENIVNRTFGILPRYGATLWTVLAHPVSAVAPRARDGRHVWDAVLFWSMSVGIYLITRYIGYSPGADPVDFFVARGIGFLVQLLVVAAAFWLVWRLFGAIHPLGSFIIATACLHGAVLPLETVLLMGAFGAVRLIEEDLFRVMVNTVNGCGQFMSLDLVREMLSARLQAAPTQVSGLILLGLGLAVPLVGVQVGYGIAYARVLARLAEGDRPFGLVRVLPMLVLGCMLALAGMSFATLFDWTLFRDPALCMPVGANLPGGGG